MLHFGSTKETQNGQNGIKSMSEYLKYCFIGIQILLAVLIVGMVSVIVICWIADIDVELLIGKQEPFDPILPLHNHNDMQIMQYSNSFAANAVPNNINDAESGETDWKSAESGETDWKREAKDACDSLKREMDKTGADVRYANEKIDELKKQVDKIGKYDPKKASVKAGTAAINAVAANLDKFTSKDPLQITQGALQVAAGLSLVVPPPYGEALSAIFGLSSAICGLFGEKAPNPVEVMQNMIDEAVKQIKDKLDADTYRKLQEAVTGAQSVYAQSYSYLKALSTHGIEKLKMLEISVISTHVPIYQNSAFIGEFGRAIENYCAENSDKGAQLFPLYADLAFYRNFILTYLQSIYAVHYEGFGGVYSGVSAVIETTQFQDLRVLKNVNPPNYVVWVPKTDDYTKQSWRNYREYQKSREVPELEIRWQKFSIPAETKEGSDYGKMPDNIDTMPMRSETPMTGLYFYQKSNRVALGGTTCNIWDVENKLMFGVKSYIREDKCCDDNDYIKKPKYWDMHELMVDDPTTQAIFGAHLYEYGNRVGIKIRYGRADGSGDKKWKGTSKWGETKDKDFFETPEYFDKTYAKDHYRSGYVVGVQMFKRGNRAALNVWKTKSYP